MSKQTKMIRVDQETHALLHRLRVEMSVGSPVRLPGSGPSLNAIVHAALVEYQRHVSEKWRKLLGDKDYEQTVNLMLASEQVLAANRRSQK